MPDIPMPRIANALAFACLFSAPADAQRSIADYPISGGIHGLYAEPLGDFRRYVDRGWGIGVDGRWFPAAQKALSIRGDIVFLNYGRFTTRECFGGGCRIQIDINTSNNILSGTVGPEIQVPSGPIRPYVYAVGGFTTFWTQTSAEGQNENDNVFDTTNLRDNILSAAFGGGLRIPVADRVMLDLSARRHVNGRARYLTRDSFGDGSATLPLVRESDVNMWTYGIGVSLGR